MTQLSSVFRQLILILTLSIAFSVQGQEGNSLLWKVSGKGMETPSYLFGTMHVSDSVIHALVTDSLEKVIATCDVFLSELSFSEVENFDQMKMMEALLMPEGKTLEDFYTEEEYAEMQDFFTKNMGIGALMVPRMKPFYTLATLQQLQMMGDSAMAAQMDNASSEPVLDNLLSNVADSLGLELKGLETVQEQLGAIDKIPLDKQAESLKYYIDHFDETEENAEDLYQAYANQDLKSIQRLVKADQQSYELLEKPLIIERNKIMHQRLSKFFENKSVFCAVGLLHLIGETGLIQKLREDGYSVEPIGF